MAGIKKLRFIQLGREATAGTEVNAATIWRGLGTIENRLTTVFPEEDVGYLGGLDRAYIPKVLAALDMESVPATYEHLPHIFEAGIAVEVATQDGAGTDYIYAYVHPTTAINTLKTYTIEAGDNQQEEQFVYGFVESYTLSGVAGESVMLTAQWLGREVAPGTKTAALSVIAVEEILTSKGKVYIDAVGGTIGTTQITNSILKFEYTENTGLIPIWTADGQIYFTHNRSVAPEITLQLTFEHDTSSVAEIAKWLAGTSSLVRLTFEGSTFGTPGTTYSVHTFIMDNAGQWEKFEKVGEQDGVDIITGTLRVRYNSTGSLFQEMVVVNELSALA